jgi:hypothetical protein
MRHSAQSMVTSSPSGSDVTTERTEVALGSAGVSELGCCMAKKLAEAVDELLDALVWMRRKAKKHEPVDDVIDALMKMRRRAKRKLAKTHPKKSPKAKKRKRLSSQGRK